jgi:hypothetical protein
MADRGARGDEARAGHLRLVREEQRHVERARLRTPSVAVVREWLDVRCPPLDGEFDDDFDELFDEDRVYGEFHDEIERICRLAIAGTLEERTTDAVRDVRELVDVDGAAMDPGQMARAEIAGLARSIARESLAGRLSVVRVRHQEVAMAEPAASWVEATLGVTAGAAARRVSVLLSGPSDADVEEELLDELGDDAVPALVWLTSGVVARFGGGDVAWLRSRRLTFPELFSGGV